MLCTSLTESSDPLTEVGPIQISTILDTWIHLSYAIQGGERNRALTIIKSRGTKHSDQVRELLLSDAGVTLADVYSERGEVLMGTLRDERIAEETYQDQHRQLEFERKQRELTNDTEELTARIEALQRERQAKEQENALMQQEYDTGRQQRLRQRAIRQSLRGMDSADTTPDGDGEAHHGPATAE